MKLLFTSLLLFYPLLISCAESEELHHLREIITTQLNYQTEYIENFTKSNPNYENESQYWFLLGRRIALFEFSHWVDCIYFPDSDPPILNWPEP